MSRPQSSDLESSQIECLDVAWSDLSRPTASDDYLPSLHISSPSDTTYDGSSSISLHQKPNCSTSTYRFYGETENDLPHGFGIRIYANSGSMEKGEFLHGVFEGLGEFTCADYGTSPPPPTLSI
jgi:hypothetical protein